jgi:hypothetical protein
MGRGLGGFWATALPGLVRSSESYLSDALARSGTVRGERIGMLAGTESGFKKGF